MRSFIAIELDSDTKKFLSDIQHKLRLKGIKGNYSRPENFHITLKFLGDIDLSVFNKVCEIIKKVAISNKSFVLKLNRLGIFNRGKKMIIWSGLKKSNNLLKVYEDLQKELEHILPDIERRCFTPHITLLREANYTAETKDFISDLVLDYQFYAAGISLMESTRIDGKLTYIRRAYQSFEQN
ncbi:MAG: RNA 2',3'-cyclic phosphodiesterase [Clostridiaceae bacterium]|nr:RNA 2',3'-cyclic phosphodiesterase [Clostridiaceae bacterium]